MGKGVRGLHLFIALIFVIGLLAVFGDKGLTDVWRLKGDRDRILSTNKALVKQNSELEKKITLLKKDKRYIEKIARDELGMVGKNDVIYRFAEKRQSRMSQESNAE